ncbi:hypothetical protein Q4S45_08685 [Massilia sp. R2A-15]|uniref:hypothetical protein n=1 Tax=Massilia sp. R2A-15 TaxID=3064278 RepID=UPI0027330DC6|nr:hypothetical protein [Massilia sp. R2A-15]WLI91179.1 hypothetical protein Q4S45_08685 [Massilia sp. R2A-15]
MVVKLFSAMLGALLLAWIVVYEFGCRFNNWWSGVELDAASSMYLLILAFVTGLVLRVLAQDDSP